MGCCFFLPKTCMTLVFKDFLLLLDEVSEEPMEPDASDECSGCCKMSLLLGDDSSCCGGDGDDGLAPRRQRGGALVVL